jgi:hypothetical protein
MALDHLNLGPGVTHHFEQWRMEDDTSLQSAGDVIRRAGARSMGSLRFS